MRQHHDLQWQTAAAAFTQQRGPPSAAAGVRRPAPASWSRPANQGEAGVHVRLTSVSRTACAPFCCIVGMASSLASRQPECPPMDSSTPPGLASCIEVLHAMKPTRSLLTQLPGWRGTADAGGPRRQAAERHDLGEDGQGLPGARYARAGVHGSSRSSRTGYRRPSSTPPISPLAAQPHGTATAAAQPLGHALIAIFCGEAHADHRCNSMPVQDFDCANMNRTATFQPNTSSSPAPGGSVRPP